MSLMSNIILSGGPWGTNSCCGFARDKVLVESPEHLKYKKYEIGALSPEDFPRLLTVSNDRTLAVFAISYQPFQVKCMVLQRSIRLFEDKVKNIKAHLAIRWRLPGVWAVTKTRSTKSSSSLSLMIFYDISFSLSNIQVAIFAPYISKLFWTI